MLDGSLTLHISGCAKGCAHPRAAALTFVGQERGAGLVVSGRAGDTATAHLPPGDLPASVARIAAVISAMRHPDERSADVVARLGADRPRIGTSSASRPMRDTLDYLRDGAAIYARSFAIIRREADLARFTPDEAEVAVRMIHASGMVELAPHIVFGPGLVAAARRGARRRRADPLRRRDGRPRHHPRPPARRATT